ncbi:MAG: PfkB family carbohydrate kinase [Solirubrobacteraceae bacterium]
MILVAGEALFDLVSRDGEQLAAHPGGGPFNAARTLGRLGRPVAFLGRISTDRFGTVLAGMLAQDGVALDPVLRTDDPTTLALAELDTASDARYRFYAAGTSAPDLTPELALALIPRDLEMLHVGTLGLVLEPMAGALEALVNVVADRALVFVDPNCRPSAIDDEIGYRDRITRVVSTAHVAKVSADDLAWLRPGEPPLDAARALLDHGPAAVLLTRGGEGASVVCEAGTIDVSPPPVEVVDTIGAGDAFGGGFLGWWHEHGHGPEDLHDPALLEQATAFAALVAARTCARAGASPPARAEL